MKYKLTLIMENAVVEGHKMDITIDWQENLSKRQLLDYSTTWITERNFLTIRMLGLRSVGESSLTIEPLGEENDAITNVGI